MMTRALAIVQLIAVVGAAIALPPIVNAAPAAACKYQVNGRWNSQEGEWEWQWAGGCPPIVCDENGLVCSKQVVFIGIHTFAICACGDTIYNACVLAYAGLEQPGAQGAVACINADCDASCDIQFGAPGPGGWMPASCVCDS